MRHCLALFMAASVLSFPAVTADDKEKNPDEIGNRDVGKGMNFYSVEKEISCDPLVASSTPAFEGAFAKDPHRNST